MNKDFKLEQLFVDLDYQKHFTYEKRVDLFNKYGYSTSMAFFTPIYHLSNHVLSFCGFTPDNRYGFGHGKYALDLTLKEKAENTPYNEFNPFRYKRLTKHEYAKSSVAFRGTFVRYWLTNEGEWSVRIDSASIRLPSINVYEKIDEWISDLFY